jgi:hypothetical protein
MLGTFGLDPCTADRTLLRTSPFRYVKEIGDELHDLRHPADAWSSVLPQLWHARAGQLQRWRTDGSDPAGTRSTAAQRHTVVLPIRGAHAAPGVLA